MYIVRMADLRIEWDPAKERANLRKHGISFDEAETPSRMTMLYCFPILTIRPSMKSAWF